MNKSLTGLAIGSILSAMLLFAACGEPGNRAKEVRLEQVVPDTVHTAQTSLDYWGTYKGVVPCADCEGIETIITLDTAHQYTLSTRYLGKKENTGTNLKGTWKWADGSTIELEGITSAPAKYFVGENKLIQLDMEGRRIEGALAEKYILTRQQ
jgi:uncharacterized lipoprotein NlpE involved in copper resistance